MSEKLLISLSKQLKKKISRASKEYKLSQSKIVQRAVDKYLVNLELLELRTKLKPYAEKKKFFTDKDMFGNKKIS